MSEERKSSNKSLAQRVSHFGNLRKQKITQEEVDIVLATFQEYIVSELINEGEFKWIGFFSLRLKRIKGHKIQDFEQENDINLSDYFRLYTSPSQKLKKLLKNILL